MQFRNVRFVIALAVALGINSVGSAQTTYTLKVLHSFAGGSDGQSPQGALWRDAKGNLYGMTYGGGSGTACYQGCGVVFEVSPQADGTWTEQVIHEFQGTTDGGKPDLNGVVGDAAGNIYGGSNPGTSETAGVLFELSPVAGGGWDFKALVTYDYSNGAFPTVQGFDPDGNLWGEAWQFFELTPNGSGWNYNVITPPNFLGPTFTSARKAYGTNRADGTPSANCNGEGCGTVRELYRDSAGVWKESVLYNFQGGNDGCYPGNTVKVGPNGHLYGTTTECGGAPYGGDGTVFELVPGEKGKWTENVILAFNGPNGNMPWGPPILDAAGNLYGTTSLGGPEGLGSVFELSNVDGVWTETVLHNFAQSEGVGPSGSLIRDSKGNLYGVALGGGAYDAGTVFELIPEK